MPLPHLSKQRAIAILKRLKDGRMGRQIAEDLVLEGGEALKGIA